MAHYRHLNQKPELSLKEKRTADYLAAELDGLGFDVSRHIGGQGFVAVMENGDGPTLLYRADMDALPIEKKTSLPFASSVTATNAAGVEVPVMHAYGHDVHMGTLLGVARRMVRERDDWHGTLLLVLEAAEEIGAGAQMLIDNGLYERLPLPDYNLAFHVSPDLPAGTIGLIGGYAMANVDSVDITVHGVGGHGAYPQKTLDPIVIAAQIVTGLQTIVSRGLSPLDSAVVTVGSIHGGNK